MVKVQTVGRVNTVEINVTQKGTPHAKISVASDSTSKDDQGKYITEWTNFEAWNKTAEYIERNIAKGDIVEVWAEKISNKSQKDGKWYTNYYIREINRHHKAPRDGVAGNAPAATKAPAAPASDFSDEEIPF